MMPIENGLQFAKRIKNDPETARTKILIWSSMSWHGDLTDVRESGIEAVLTKPMRRKDLIDATARAITGTRHPGWTPEQSAIDAITATLAGTVTDQALPRNIKAHILIAEDNPVNIEVMKEFLSALGCSFTVAVNGLEAVTVFRSETFDLVLMDCQMPIMDGISATRRIRAYETELDLSTTPIIAVTANAYAEDRTQCLDAGMNDYLSKPFTERELAAIVHRWHDSPRGKKSTQSLKPTEVVLTKRDAPIEGSKPDQKRCDKAPTANTKRVSDVIDVAVLDTLRASRPDLLARLIKTYLGYAPEALKELVGAFERKDFETLSRVAHSLKSSSANLGANRLSDLCRSLEAAGKGHDHDHCATLVTDIQTNFAQVQQTLNEISNQQSSDTATRVQQTSTKR
jgi:two-component system, sensor histidine kinase and response regulator